MKFEKSIVSELISEVVNVTGDYGGGYASFEEDGPPTASIDAKERSQWIWVTSRADYEGRTWDPSTDRVSGDPYSAHTYHDWIGDRKTAPKTVSKLVDLYEWALFHVGYNQEYTDVGSWGVHSGRWVNDVSPDGIVKLRVQSSRTFQDVSPVAQTTGQELDLSVFKDRSFDALIKLVEDENPFVREVASILLGRMGDPRAVDPFLINVVDDESIYVQEKGIEALGKIGGEKAIRKLIVKFTESKYSPRSSVTYALIEIGEPALDSLAPIINSENESHGMAAAGIIGAIGGKKGAKILHEAISIDNPKVRTMIIYALGRSGGSVAIESIIKNLQAEDIDVQRAAVDTLKELADKRAIEPLVDTLIANHAWVREDAAETLEALGWTPSTPEEKARYLFAKAEWEKLIKMKDVAIEAIIKSMMDSDEYHRGRILTPLAESDVTFTDVRIAEAIIAIYTDENQQDYRRRAAAEALRCIPILEVIRLTFREYLAAKRSYIQDGFLKTIESFVMSGIDLGDELVSLLKRRKTEQITDNEMEDYFKLFKTILISHKHLMSIRSLLKAASERKLESKSKKIVTDLLALDELLTDFSVDTNSRKKAVTQMWKIGLPVEIPLLIEALEDSHYKIRENAAFGLGSMGESVVPKVIDALRSTSYRTRMGAAVALGRLRHTQSAKPLLKALTDKHPVVRQNAAWALGNLRLARPSPEKLAAIVIKALTKSMTTDEYFPVRYNAVYALSITYDGRVAEPLLEAADNPAWEFRLNATYGFVKLAQIYRESSDTQELIIEKLIQSLSDEVDRVRYNAVDGLRLFGGKKALAALKSYQDDEDPEMRKLVEEGIEEITQMMGQERHSWGYTERVQYELHEPEVIEELIQQLRNEDEEVQLEAQIALGDFGGLAFDRLLGILQDKDEFWMLREGSAGALGRIGDRRAIDTLLKTLQDENDLVRCNSAWALAEMPDKRCLKDLLKATKDEFWMTRLNAAAGIGKIGGRLALERLLGMVDDEHPKVRVVVTSYLAQFKSKRVLPALKGLLKDEDVEVRKMAEQWIKRLER